jgi:hypothetical protein
VKAQMKLKYSNSFPEERKIIVEKILEENPNPPSSYLEILADYLSLCMEKQEKKEKKILTENRSATINKRETSFEGLSLAFENGEDGIYNLIREDKNIIFRPKISITKQDEDDIPYLKQLRQGIAEWELAQKSATGKAAYIMKKSLIEMRKDQYLIRTAFKPPVVCSKLNFPKPNRLLDSEEHLDENNQLVYSGASLCDPAICSLILCNYSRLKQNSWGDFEGDFYFLMEDFDDVSERALRDYPLYQKITLYKVDGKTNAQIKKLIQEELNIIHNEEYYSTIWRNKIPKLIASQAQEDYLLWYYKNHPSPMKKCGKCGQDLPAHDFFFSRNKKNFYSICKKCRRKRR